jgi:hypothetical protein
MLVLAAAAGAEERAARLHSLGGGRQHGHEVGVAVIGLVAPHAGAHTFAGSAKGTMTTHPSTRPSPAPRFVSVVISSSISW